MPPVGSPASQPRRAAEGAVPPHLDLRFRVCVGCGASAAVLCPRSGVSLAGMRTKIGRPLVMPPSCADGSLRGRSRAAQRAQRAARGAAIRAHQPWSGGIFLFRISSDSVLNPQGPGRDALAGVAAARGRPDPRAVSRPHAGPESPVWRSAIQANMATATKQDTEVEELRRKIAALEASSVGGGQKTGHRMLAWKSVVPSDRGGSGTRRGPLPRPTARRRRRAARRPAGEPARKGGAPRPGAPLFQELWPRHDRQHSGGPRRRQGPGERASPRAAPPGVRRGSRGPGPIGACAAARARAAGGLCCRC